jgi:AraC-like DNA-binding protein
MSEFFDSFCPHILDVSHIEVVRSRTFAQSREEAFFGYVYDGRGSLETDDVACALTAGNAVHVPRGRRVVLRGSSASPLRFYTVRYAYAMVEWEGMNAVLRESDDGIPFEPIAQVPNPASFLEEMKQLHREWTRRSPGFCGKAKLAFLALLHRLMEEQHLSRMEQTTKRAILECARYIEQHYRETLERNALARKFSISTSYFSVLFKKYVGCSPVQYITRVRIAKAMELLKDSNLPVSAVALEVGYNDPLYFSRVFSRQVGLTPRQFREA